MARPSQLIGVGEHVRAEISGLTLLLVRRLGLGGSRRHLNRIGALRHRCRRM